MNSPLSRTPKTLHAFALTITLSIAHLHAAPIPGLFNTGVDNTGAALPDNTVDTHYTITVNPDGGLPDAIVEDSTVFPIVAGPWLANSATSKWIGPRLETSAAAAGDYTYSITFDLTGLDPASAIITGQWTSDNAGPDILINGVSTGNSNPGSFGAYTAFTISTGFIDGLNTLEFRVNNAALGYTGLRVELSGTAFPPGAPPVIVTQPRSQIVAAGQPTSFSVIAQGSPAPTYQWRFDGTAMPGETASTLTIASPASFDAGNYDVVASNTSGSVTSSVASLTVGLPMTNPSFEADTFGNFPGYVSGNTPITGWSALGGHGINPGTSFSPFADNGVIPHGTKVAFMQADGPMTQRVTGFTPGEIYYVHYYENSRGGNVPGIAVTITDDTNTLTLVAEHVVTSVGGSNPYYEVSSQSFIATAAEMTLAFVKSNPRGGDNTVLVDNVAIVQIQPTTPPFITQQPGGLVVEVSDPIALSVNAIGGLPLSYQWRRDGSAIAGATNSAFNIASALEIHEGDYTVVITNAYGAVTSAVARVIVFEPIVGLFNTGVDNSGVPLPDSTIDPHYTLTVNPDVASTDAIVQTGIPGAWLANSATSKWIGPQANTSASAVGSYTYRTTIDLTGRDPSTVIIFGRWATDNPGIDIQVNGVSTTNVNTVQFPSYTRFALSSTNAAFVAGTNTIDFIVENAAPPGPTGLRVEIDQSNVKIPVGTPPAITRHPTPTNQIVAVGDSVTFTGEASGSAPLSYQWRRNGVAIPGQTNSTLTLTNLSAADSGDYTLAVTNLAGTAISEAATVCVCFTVVPGIFGTGLDDNGALLDNSAVDPHYTLTQSSDPTYLGPESYAIINAWPIAPAGPWPANGPRSRWIGPRAEQDQTANPAFGNQPGNYTFQTTFDLFGVDMSRFHLQGRWAVDNTGMDIVVNGVSSGITSPGFGALTEFAITNGLVAGINTLDFVMNNAGTSVNPAGLRVDLRGLLSTAATAPRLTITHQANQVVVSWTPTAQGQQLQAAPSLNGPTINWQTITGATSPHTLNADTQMRFFRVVQ
jgi:hypothetical protein